MTAPSEEGPGKAGTILGLLAILFWGMSVAFTRRVAEEFGALHGMALAYAAGGALGCLWQALTGRLVLAMKMPPAYHLVCGGLMVAYGLCYAAAIGCAQDRQTVLEIGILNYLWPGLTMVLALPILHRKASWMLWPGTLIAFAGAALTIGQGKGFSWLSFGQNLATFSPAHVLAIGGALIWALYSNFNTRLAAGARGEAAPLHLVAMGLGLLLLHLAVGKPGQWHPTTAGWFTLGATALFPVLLGYLFWDVAMRRGDLGVVIPVSYAIPLLSTLITGLVLNAWPGSALWTACLLVVAGAILCRKAVP